MANTQCLVRLLKDLIFLTSLMKPFVMKITDLTKISGLILLTGFIKSMYIVCVVSVVES